MGSAALALRSGTAPTSLSIRSLHTTCGIMGGEAPASTSLSAIRRFTTFSSAMRMRRVTVSAPCTAENQLAVRDGGRGWRRVCVGITVAVSRRARCRRESHMPQSCAQVAYSILWCCTRLAECRLADMARSAGLCCLRAIVSRDRGANRSTRCLRNTSQCVIARSKMSTQSGFIWTIRDTVSSTRMRL